MRKGGAQKILNEYFDRECEWPDSVNVNAGIAQHFCDWGGLNKMPKAFLARAAGASVLGGSGGMLPRKIFKINASRMAKNTFQYSRHSEFFCYLLG